MARAVQCPACGQVHPVDTLAGTPTFPCEGCARTLRTPTELVRPSGSTPAVRSAAKPAAPAPLPRPRAAAPPAAGHPEAAPLQSPRPPRARRSPTASGALTLPLRIGAWIVAVVVGLMLTWIVASAFGFVSRSVLVDMFRSSSPGNYIRLFLLIPVWAFMSACLATALIEGVRLSQARRAARQRSEPRSSPPPVATPPAVEEEPSRPAPPSEPLPPGQRRRIRPREPTV